MHSILLAFALFAPLSPTIISKQLVMISFSLLFLRRFNYITLTSNLRFKIISTAFFSFSIFSSFFGDKSQIIRFIPIFYLIWFFPYLDNYSLKASFLKRISLAIMLLMIISQFLLAFEEPFTLAFRETFYPFNNIWTNNAVFSKLNYDSLTVFRGFRLGGLWYNPNLFASNLFLVYIAFYSTTKYLLKISNDINKIKINRDFLIVTAFVFISLLSSGSRTFIVSHILLILISKRKYILKIAFFKSSLLSSIILYGLIGFIFSYGFVYSLIRAFSDGGSVDFKLSVLNKYFLNSPDFMTILTGSGNINFTYDFEYSYWFVLGGLCSLIGLFIFYTRISKFKSSYFIYITLPLILAGLGTSILFGLMSGSLLIPVLIIVYNFEVRENLLIKK